jgi:hypothetical protein
MTKPDTWPATTLNRAPSIPATTIVTPPRCDFIETVEEPPQPGHADIAYHHRRHAMESESTLRLDGDAHVGRTRASIPTLAGTP